MSEKRMNVVRQHLDAFLDKNWDQYRETMLPDVRYVERATDRKVEGIDKLIETLKTWTVAFPDLEVDIQNLLVQDDMVMAELRWKGTHKGQLKGTFGAFEPTGKTGVVDAIEIFRFEGDKIAEARHYFDMMTLLRQIGVTMPAGFTTEPTPL